MSTAIAPEDVTQPYSIALDEGRQLFVELPAGAWRPARHGDGWSLTPAGGRLIDKLRAMAEAVPKEPTAGRVKALRSALELTQVQLAERIEVSPLTISRWERGQVRPNTEASRRLERLRRAAGRRGLVISDPEAKR